MKMQMPLKWIIHIEKRRNLDVTLLDILDRIFSGKEFVEAHNGLLYCERRTGRNKAGVKLGYALHRATVRDRRNQ